MLLVTSVISALSNVVLLAGLPFLGYVVFHKWRHRRTFAEIARRAGLQIGETRYLAYSLLIALIVAAALAIWPISIEASTRDGSAFQRFAGLGLGGTSIAMALLYGIIETGFAEELLFRGLIAGSLSRCLPFLWANVLQALIFVAPHGLLLLIMPEIWGLLPLIFAFALLAGWLRIRSGSILGPWLMHASANVTMGLMVAIRTVGAATAL